MTAHTNRARPSATSALDDVLQRLKASRSRSLRRDYLIPSIWAAWAYTDGERARGAQLRVDPHHYIADCIERIILPQRTGRGLRGASLSQATGVKRANGGRVIDGAWARRAGDWIRRATLYATLIRTTSAWDHNADGALKPTRRWTETGTFLKTIALLPLLRRMGMSVLYMLPVSKVSRRFRKGEVGCPYSAKNFFELEPDLHDRLLGPDESLVDLEFAAMVEAAHALGMRVMVDLAPRTAARDSDLILDHPTWFYWIDAKAHRGYGPPHIDGHRGGMPASAELGGILKSDVMRLHLAKFRFAPSVTQPARWKAFAARSRKNPPADLLAEITRAFGVITPPGFSDCINDPQPPWSDVTFLRLFLDHPAASAKHLPKDQPPYVFTDTIKSSLFPGRKPNLPLWNMLADILPFYQRFGIDGARVDMGHALPPRLQKMIIARPRRRDFDFCFLAEEFNHAAAPAQKKAGYNAIIGSCWWMLPRAGEGELHRLVQQVLPASALPALAAAETPDTPRAVVRKGGVAFARMVAVLEHFLPGGVPLINSGQEVLERQPLNLGLDLGEPGRYALPKGDPYYGKLGYFDRVALHWGNKGGGEMVELISRAGEVRRYLLAVLTEEGNHFFPRFVRGDNRVVLAIGFGLSEVSSVIVVANVDFRRGHSIVLDRAAPRKCRDGCHLLMQISTQGPPPTYRGRKLSVQLPPGDVKVILLHPPL